jgi:hypothetical protein
MIKLGQPKYRRSLLGSAVDLRAAVDIKDVDDAAALVDLVDDAVGAKVLPSPGPINTGQDSLLTGY